MKKRISASIFLSLMFLIGCSPASRIHGTWTLQNSPNKQIEFFSDKTFRSNEFGSGTWSYSDGSLRLTTNGWFKVHYIAIIKKRNVMYMGVDLPGAGLNTDLSNLPNPFVFNKTK